MEEKVGVRGRGLDFTSKDPSIEYVSPRPSPGDLFRRATEI